MYPSDSQKFFFDMFQKFLQNIWKKFRHPRNFLRYFHESEHRVPYPGSPHWACVRTRRTALRKATFLTPFLNSLLINATENLLKISWKSVSLREVFLKAAWNFPENYVKFFLKLSENILKTSWNFLKNGLKLREIFLKAACNFLENYVKFSQKLNKNILKTVWNFLQNSLKLSEIYFKMREIFLGISWIFFKI